MRLVVAPLIAAFASYLFFSQVMAYPWQLALLVALAIGALVFSSQRTMERLRSLLIYEEDPLRGSRLGMTPRKEASRRQQEQMHHGRESSFALRAPERQGEPARERETSQNETGEGCHGQA